MADRLPGQVNNAEKSRRSKRMADICRRTAESYADTYIGRTVPVLLE